MNAFVIHDQETAPVASKEILEQVRQKFGFVPNLLGELAAAPPALKAYLTLSELFAQTTLTPVEQQAVLLTVSFANRCDYCMAAHSMGAKMQGVPDDVVRAIRDGRPIPVAKLESLRQFVQAVVRDRGGVSSDAVEKFISAGFSPAQVFEVMLGVAMKTLSNYSNHIAHTPLDPAFKAVAWTQPKG